MRNNSIRALIGAVARGRFFFIGRPGAIGHYIHEENAVDALLLCATTAAARGRTYNLSQSCTFDRMVATIASGLGRTPPATRIPEFAARLASSFARLAPGFPLTPARVDVLTSRVEYRSTRIERELGYAHAKPVEDALRALTAAWQAGAA
jgi:nucleoside-diphosphate-sugar epimerase